LSDNNNIYFYSTAFYLKSTHPTHAKHTLLVSWSH